MFKKICLLALFAIICPLAIFSQNDIEKYQPPKVIDGSDLTIDAGSGFSVVDDGGIRRRYSISFSPRLSKFRYTDKLNYVVNTGLRGGFSHSHRKDEYDTSTSNSSGISIDIEGGMNYYFIKNMPYAGLNSASYNRFGGGKPSSNNYIGPNIGFGRIVNASEVSRTHFFEQILKRQKVISGSLPYNVRKKLTELFDKRNNREFIYRFKDDDEIEFFSDVEKLLKDNGLITGTLDSRAVLTLYQSLVNTKYLVYPKYKGYQMQTMFYFPFGSTEGSGVDLPYELVLSGIYGLPLSMKTQLVFYGFFSKLFNVTDNNNYPTYFFGFNVRNIFPLSIENYQYDNPESKFFTEYAIGYDSRRVDYYFGGNISVFHNFTEFLGIRGYANLLNYRDKADQDYVLTAVSSDVYLDYGILSRLILSGRLSTYVTTVQGETNYLLNGGVNLSYIVF